MLLRYLPISLCLTILLFISPAALANDAGSEDLQAAVAELRAMVLSQQEAIRAQQTEIQTLKKKIEDQNAEIEAISLQSYPHAPTRFPVKDTVATSTETVTAPHSAPVQEVTADGKVASADLSGTASPPGSPVAVPDAPSEPSPVAPGKVDVTSKFGIELYGYIKVDGVYTSQDVFTDTVPFYVRPSNGSNDDYQFNMSAKETRFGAKLNGPEFGGGKLTGLAEFDFYGDFAEVGNRSAYKLRTRQLYINYDYEEWGVLAGKTWQTYISTFPQTINFTYYNLMGQLGMRNTQIRLTREQKIDDDSNLTLKVAFAETAGNDLDGDLINDGAESDIPTVEYLATYSVPVLTDKPAEFSFSGFYGRERADVNADGHDQDFNAYAVIGGLTFPLTDQLTLKGTIWTGTNLDAAWGGIGQGINPTTGETIDATGGWVQLGYQATEKLKFNLGYSIDDPKDSDLNAGNRSFNTSYLVNAFYSFTPSFILGLEYMRLETGYKDRSDEATNWLQSSLIFKF